MIWSLFYRTAQLRQCDHRHIDLSCQRFQRSGNIGNLLLSGIGFSASAHQLQVIDHDNSKIVLQLIFPAFGTKFRNRNSRSIVNNKIGATDDICTFHQLRPVFIFQISGTEILRIHMGFHGKKTVYQLLLGHLQTEDRHGHIFTKCHILGNIQHKSSFSHGRSRRNQYKVGRMHTGGLIIQIYKSGRNSGDGAFQLGSLLNVTDCI